jgi:hemolysin-activating ACP:hemolysin acyltransferase
MAIFGKNGANTTTANTTTASASPTAPSQPATAPPPPRQRPSAEALKDPAVQKQLAEVRTRIQAAVGQITLALASLPRYRNQMLGDVQSLVLDPLMRDRVAIASETATTGDDAMANLAGIAFWATVSPEVDARIREQVKTGAFPIKMKPDDWNSGDIVWLLDVIAPSQKLATQVLLNFRKVLKDQSDVRMHPVVARQIDPELLKKLTAPAAVGKA